jgi:ABC-type uncharacterized transport system involved in gliding motility auxiliary subunit
MRNSLAGHNGFALIAEYVHTNHAADELHRSIRGLRSLPRTIVPRAKPIRILDNVYHEDISPVLASHATSAVFRGDETVRQGRQEVLMAVASRTHFVNNDPRTSLLLVSGSTDFTASAFLGNNAFSNSDIIYNAIRIMGQRRVPSGIDFRIFAQRDLDVSLEEANNYTLIATLLLPSIVFGLGLIVWMKRRHS